ncbi:MAG: hypothetical protein KIT69_03850 [Propionibacteriaceae bacterium]|nr:hypothetical protein [Propionibacteriaceae bacterium]
MEYTPHPDPSVFVHELPHEPHAHPIWQVYLDGALVGWVRRHTLRGCSSHFYQAEAVHPETGIIYNLDSSIELGNRVEKVVAYRRDPKVRNQLYMRVWP